jgi:hypothetical protein
MESPGSLSLISEQVLDQDVRDRKDLLDHEQHRPTLVSRLLEPLAAEDLFCRLLGLWIFPWEKMFGRWS